MEEGDRRERGVAEEAGSEICYVAGFEDWGCKPWNVGGL